MDGLQEIQVMATKYTAKEKALIQKHMRLESDQAIERFVLCLREGFDGFCASVAATGDIPGTGKTDRALMQGRMNGEELAHPVWRKRAKAVEAKHPGLANGRTYYPSLARYANDPGAWCGSYAELKEQAVRAGKGIEGVYEPPPRDPPKQTALSETVINSHLRRELRDDPSLVQSKKRLKKVREDIITKHTPYWKRHLLKG